MLLVDIPLNVLFDGVCISIAVIAAAVTINMLYEKFWQKDS